MAGLPKIALARLKAQPHAPESSGASGGPADFQGGRHPDANLLAAFVEKTLTEKERTQVLTHLSQCADCREIAALSMPTEAAIAPPVRVAAGRRWNPWPVLRWGAMAAVLGGLTIVVVLHPDMWKRQQEISKVTSTPAPAGNAANPPQAAAPLPSAPSPAKTAQAKPSAEARESAGALTSMAKISGARRDISLQDNEEQATAKKQVTALDSTRPPAPVRADNLPSVQTAEGEGKGGNAMTAVAPPHPSLPFAPAAMPMAAYGVAGQASSRSHGAPSALSAGAQSGEVTARQEPLRTPSPSVAAEVGNAGTSRGEAIAAKAAPQRTTLGGPLMRAQASMGGAAAYSADKELEAGPPAALWTVSSQGQVQRTTHAGKTLEPIQVARGIKFMTVAALGNDVWAGGTRGALFHSLDGGTTWNRVSITVEGNAVTETLTDIQLHDPQHLTVTTTSGSKWASDDGGQHWQRKP